MEHVKESMQNGRQIRLTAEKGWLLKSKVTEKTYKEIDTCDRKRWTVVADENATIAEEVAKPVGSTRRRRSKTAGA